MFLDHNKIKLEVNNGSKSEKSINRWKLNNPLLCILWVKEEITREIRTCFELNEMKVQHINRQ